ncbi:bifunctional phosphoribosylaminoimidazolecarboxamide formyltransferase/IMP cyclohydrolase [Candidatus Poribacteria bacterium]|nr:bifunctional phosphoribosylaminoimidazolecarboxamide formyltransferase/IMP cyclohydrolase [Candidatus Poribacteria bacterium]
MAKIQRALISVSDKAGVAAFARGLAELGVEILSTGGTARLLKDEKVPVRDVSDFTGFPEMMDGRVKTLHPKVHGGILAMRGNPEHIRQAKEHGIGLIDLVVVNLYPFRQTVAKPDVTYEDAIENIDIGGPTMVRSAAKNHADVGIVTSPSQYGGVLAELSEKGKLSEATRRSLARAAFEHTAEYDSAIATYLSTQDDEAKSDLPPRLAVHLKRAQSLRYGENPHQKGAFYHVVDGQSPWERMEQLHGMELSYCNFLDADGAWSAACDFDEPTAAVIKHSTPCGLASDEDLIAAWKRAFLGDPVSAFGGIVAFNRPVDDDLAKAIRLSKHPTSGDRLLLHIIMAPDYTPDALERLSKSRDLRILKLPVMKPPRWTYRSVSGAMLVQESDNPDPSRVGWKVVTKREPTEAETADLRFAWKCVKHVKSNAIVVCKNRTMLGMGAGQPNRVNSVRLALAQAGEEAGGAVLASDAFFPFLDGVAIGVAHGVTGFIHPGGSLRDADSVAVADAAGATMVFTGMRHFRH